MDWHYSVFWIVLIFKLTCGEYCLRTLDTVRDVSSCPLNIEEWEAAAKRIDCNRIKMTRNCEDAVYHCLRDAVKKTMVEVCTVPKNLNGFCPYFYRDPPYVRNDYDRDCSKSSMCPNFYSSKDSYNYSVCYNDTSILAAVSTSEPTSSTVLNPTRIITVQIISAGGTADTKEENDETWMKIFFPIVSLMMLIIAYIIALCRVKKSESDISWKQAFWSVNHQILRIACCKCFRKDDNGVTSANPEKCEDSVHLPLLEDSDHLGNNESNVNTNPPDRIPVQDPQTPESTTPDKSNSSKNGIFQMSPTQGVITDTTDSTNAVPKDSVSSSETKIPVKQDGNDPETCNRPSSSEPFSESSAKTSVNTNPPDRIPVQDPQTPESTTPAPDKSNSSKNGKSLMSPTQGTMTDTTDSTSAVTGNSVLSSETNAPVKQYGNKAETCNRPSSSEPFSESSAKTSGNESTALLITQETQESVNSQLEGIQAQDETPLLTEVNVYDKEEVKRDNDTDRERKIEKVDEMKVSKSVNVDSTLVPNKESTVAFNQLKSKDGKGESLANTSTFTEQESIMGRLRLVQTTKPGQESFLERRTISPSSRAETSLNLPSGGNVVFLRRRRSSRDGAANYIDVPQKLFHPRKLMTDIGLSLEMVDDKLKEIILSRSGLEGQVDCIERRINFLEHKLRELEKDCNILNRKTISEERGNLDRCVKWLDKKLSYLFQRTEEVEINLRTGIMPGEDDQHCDNDLNCRSIETESVVIDVVKKLEGGIKKLEERLMSLYETRSGEKGRTDMLTYIIKHQEIEVLNLEKESGIDLNLTSDFDSVSQNMRQLPSMEKFSKTLNTRLDFLKNNM